jgi:hypothetical protein
MCGAGAMESCKIEGLVYFRMLLWQTIYTLVTVVFLMPIDLIPGFGSAHRFVFRSML